jgi:hypothetical protein
MRCLITYTPHQVLDDKSRKTRLAGHVARSSAKRNICKTVVGKLEAGHLKYLGVDDRIMLKYTLKIQNEKGRTILMLVHV